MKYLALVLALVFLALTACNLRPPPQWPGAAQSEFQSLCWSGTYTIQKCDLPTVAQWRSFPLTVSSDNVTAQQVAGAVEIWNEWLGFKALVYKPLIRNGDIRIRFISTVYLPRPTVAGHQWFRKNKSGKQVALVGIFGLGVRNPDVYLHEIGHALGLDHDPENKRSIMYPYAGFSSAAARVERRDRQALRQRYLYRRR